MLLKRILDVVLSAALLALLWPVFALLALAVWLDSGRPVFFGQERVGRAFRRFRIWKFRTMIAGSSGSKVTVAGDARVTRAGRFLRVAKLDELPQFWNVLRGDMSLVGPRPEVPEYVELFRDRYCNILRLRPGITDLGSIRFRDEETVLAQASDPQRHYAEHVLPAKLDLAEQYIRGRSLGLDFAILMQTLIATLKHS